MPVSHVSRRNKPTDILLMNERERWASWASCSTQRRLNQGRDSQHTIYEPFLALWVLDVGPFLYLADGVLTNVSVIRSTRQGNCQHDCNALPKILCQLSGVFPLASCLSPFSTLDIKAQKTNNHSSVHYFTFGSAFTRNTQCGTWVEYLAFEQECTPAQGLSPSKPATTKLRTGPFAVPLPMTL